MEADDKVIDVWVNPSAIAGFFGSSIQTDVTKHVLQLSDAGQIDDNSTPAGADGKIHTGRTKE